MAVAELAATAVTAHDVPPSVTLQMFVRPQGSQLDLLVRVPLEAMQDMRFPTSGPGYLELEEARASGVLEDSAEMWVAENVEVYEAGRRLPPLEVQAVRISLPSDRSFSSVTQALGHISGERLPGTTQLVWRQALLDVHLTTDIRSDEARFAIRPQHARLGQNVTTVLRFEPPSGGVRAFEYRGNPGRVELDPRWHQAAKRFVESGFFHILDGPDHLLFLLCLIIPLRRIRQLIVVVTAFTVAHSITLIASAYGLAPDASWFPPLVELLIALSIVYMAFENIVGAKLERRWWITFGFGLIHGFGFSFALTETLQFAGTHLLTSLLSFNLGVELGQILVLVLLVPLLDLLFRRVVDERLGTILLSALIAHTSWHWMAERADALRQYRLGVPWLDSLPVHLLPWLALVGLLGYMFWGLRGKSRKTAPPLQPAEPLPADD